MRGCDAFAAAWAAGSGRSERWQWHEPPSSLHRHGQVFPPCFFVEGCIFAHIDSWAHASVPCMPHCAHTRVPARVATVVPTAPGLCWTAVPDWQIACRCFPPCHFIRVKICACHSGRANASSPSATSRCTWFRNLQSPPALRVVAHRLATATASALGWATVMSRLMKTATWRCCPPTAQRWHTHRMMAQHWRVAAWRSVTITWCTTPHTVCRCCAFCRGARVRFRHGDLPFLCGVAVRMFHAFSAERAGQHQSAREFRVGNTRSH